MNSKHSAAGSLFGLICALAPTAPVLAQSAVEEPAPAPPVANEPPPADPPPAPPAPGSEPVAPPPTVVAPVPFRAAPGAGSPEKGQSTPHPSKPSSILSQFAGSSIDWGHAANVEYLGVGDQHNLSPRDYSYVMSWSFAPSFFAYRSERHDLRLRTSVGLSVELTNSETTTQQHETQLADLPLTISDAISLFSWGGENHAPPGPAAAFDPTLEGGGQYGTWLLTEAGVVFPTSKEGGYTRYLSTRLGVGLRQRIKLLGGDAPGLRSLTLSVAETWRHDFNRTQVPTSPNVGVPRQSPGGAAIVSDITSKYFLTTDRLATSFGAILPIYAGLELSGGFAYRLDFKPAPNASECIQTLTGCATPVAGDDPQTTFAYTRFDLALAYRILPEVTVDLGYETFVSPTVRGASPLYANGYSYFYADLAFFPEQLLQRLFRPGSPAEPPPAM